MAGTEEQKGHKDVEQTGYTPGSPTRKSMAEEQTPLLEWFKQTMMTEIGELVKDSTEKLSNDIKALVKSNKELKDEVQSLKTGQREIKRQAEEYNPSPNGNNEQRPRSFQEAMSDLPPPPTIRNSADHINMMPTRKERCKPWGANHVITPSLVLLANRFLNGDIDTQLNTEQKRLQCLALANSKLANRGGKVDELNLHILHEKNSNSFKNAIEQYDNAKKSGPQVISVYMNIFKKLVEADRA